MFKSCPVWEEGIGFPILLGNKEIILELKEEILMPMFQL
jgi:hypothetical protein